MLLEISIRNIALIERLTIEFAQGFNVLTGETGAGKSIVVDSLSLALGARAGRELLRTGADKASVQALFDVSDCPRAQEMAAELGAPCEDGLLAVSRELSANGRSVCRVSGMVVPLTALKGLTSLLMDIHGQHEHQALLDPEKHLGFLDAYGGEDHLARVRAIGAAYRVRMQLAGKIKAVLKDAQGRERELAEIERRLAEIAAAKLRPGEEEELESRAAILENAEHIRASLSEAYQLTYEGAGSAQELLSRAANALEGISPIDARFSALAARLREAFIAAQDAGYELRDALEGVESDPRALEKLNARLDLIHRLEGRYGPELADVIAYGEELKARKEALSGGEASVSEWKKQLKGMDAALRQDCAALTEARRAIAARLTAGILKHLADLGMGKTRFEITVEPEKITATGGDRVEMRISPNPGEPLKPLNAIASGGEISRVMLALKAVSADEYGVGAMVFDEIDTGVSGRMAQAVGEKMAMIAGKRQVLCVTHLPQIAALADRHFVVEKTQVGERTGSTVRALDEPGRAQEIARLIGGAEDSPSAMEHAENMLAAARRRREELRARKEA